MFLLGVDGFAGWLVGAVVLLAGVLAAAGGYWLLVGAGVWRFPFEKYEQDVDLDLDCEDNFTSCTPISSDIPMNEEEERAAVSCRASSGVITE